MPALKPVTTLEQQIFNLRLKQHLPQALIPLQQLYGGRSDFDQWVEHFIALLAQAYATRPADLRLLDQQRLQEPEWYQQPRLIGYIAYADRFAGGLKGVISHIPYLKELGVTYLHLMPLLKPRPEPNDGGYAVQDYRAIDPRLGTMADLAQLTQALRAEGISLCTDIVCNHTAAEHEWAVQATAGDPTYQAYYHTFPDRTLPDQYEQFLREIFPATAPGNFRWIEPMQRWVWSTFNDYQWDLNYSNPAVLGEMLDIILYLANQGVEIFRMDAVAFMWKKLGTGCENLPEAHAILQALRCLTRIACPGIVFKAEAIVAPHEVVPYFGTGRMAGRECEIAYHNSLMVLLWSMLAEQKTVLATYSLQQMPTLPHTATWVNYVRCHDDIGWAIMDNYAQDVGLNGFWHRSFLSDFYSGVYPNSFAIGDVFQSNPETMDRRISGACASLAGLERAVKLGSPPEIDRSIKRILLLYNIIFMAGGIPLIYMGDELGLTNDYSYLDDPAKANDNRWLQRPEMNWPLAAQRHDQTSIPGRIFTGLQKLVHTRQQCHQLHGTAACQPVWLHNDQLFGLLRHSPFGRLLLVANVTPKPQTLSAYRLAELDFSGQVQDALTGRVINGRADLTLEPYQALWLVLSTE